MMTDPIADMLTRMRNALRNHEPSTTVPGSKVKVNILEVLKREGYIEGYEVHGDGARTVITVKLRYGPNRERVITDLRRWSRPGCRRFAGFEELPRPRNGLGISVVSTSKGILSDRECRAQRLGGEVLCTVE